MSELATVENVYALSHCSLAGRTIIVGSPISIEFCWLCDIYKTSGQYGHINFPKVHTDLEKSGVGRINRWAQKLRSKHIIVAGILDENIERIPLWMGTLCTCVTSIGLLALIFAYVVEEKIIVTDSPA